MKSALPEPRSLRLLAAGTLLLAAATAAAADFPIDPMNPLNNGLTEIYSATFDPPLNPSCVPGRLTAAECAFFGGQTPATREITINPTPTSVRPVADTTQCVQAFDPFNPGTVVPPCATLYPAPTPSALDLTLSAGNTMVAINGGNFYLPDLTIVISAGTASQTDVVAVGASVVNLAASAGPVPVDGNGVAVFELNTSPVLAADFATFTEIVTTCTGPLCALIPILTLDMFKYRLTIDFDPTFTSFTADFKGQTANNSMVFATLNSGLPEITVTDSVAPTGDLAVPFGSVTATATSNETVTVTNDGAADLVLGNVAQADTLAAPFSIPLAMDTCSGQTITPAASCNITARFAPTAVGMFADSFDIPSNDADEDPVTIVVNGDGTALPVPDIAVSDSVAPVDDLQIPFGSVTETMFADQTVTVDNNGNAPLVLGQLALADALAAPFSIPLAMDTCSGQTIAPAGSCTVMVRFAPVSPGSFADTFDIPSDDPDENPVTVSLSGTGTALPVPDITVTEPLPPVDDLSMPFGDVTEMTSWDRTLTITNDGNANLDVGALAQADALAAPFSLVNDACSGQIIAPAASCTVDVRFTPGGTGASNDSFDVPSNDPDEASLTVSVSGNGVALGTGTISLKPDGGDAGLFGSATGPVTLLVLLWPLAARRRRNR
ncbi:MAG: choice-of-anchor D domain-containing protein [Gammaproteobacteria bacterium]